MLNRRYLRVKVLQSLYAFLISGNDKLADGEKLLLQNFQKLEELKVWQTVMLTELADFGRRRMEEARGKFFPTEEDLNPNTRFVDNRLLKQLASNRSLQRKINAFKINWAEEMELVRKIYNKLIESRFYEKYKLQSPDNFEEDKEVLIKVVREILTGFELLEDYYETKSIYWVDDYDTANVLLIKTLNSLNEKDDEFTVLPEIFKGPEDEDRKFMIDLFNKTALHSAEFDQMIEKRLTNWDFDRLAFMDLLLIKMAICEILHFQSIPVKVTLNEYIEISKFFSTPKSKVFINGILDKLALDFKNEKLFRKTGRGLM